jgi:hypothetical protein
VSATHTTDRAWSRTIATYRRRIRDGFALAERGDLGGLEAVLDAQAAIDTFFGIGAGAANTVATTAPTVDAVSRYRLVIARAFTLAERDDVDVNALAIVLRAQDRICRILNLYAPKRVEVRLGTRDRGAS